MSPSQILVFLHQEKIIIIIIIITIKHKIRINFDLYQILVQSSMYFVSLMSPWLYRVYFITTTASI